MTEAENRKEYIVSLEAELKRVHHAYEQLQESYRFLCRENDELVKVGAKPADEVFPPLLENAALRDRIRELEAALEPFAYPEKCDSWVEAYRTAKAALAPKETT